MVDRTDAALVACVVRREIDAYTELRRRHLSSVTAVARTLLGSRAGSEDVVDDVFVAFWLDPHRFDPTRGTLLAFLRLTVRGRSIDLLRSDTARVRRETIRSTAPAAPEVDTGMLDAEASGTVRAALDALPATEREPIELAFLAGMTYHVVAVRLGLPEGTVKSRIRRGLQRMELMEGLQGLRVGSPPRSDHAARPARRRSGSP
jgi:RNA polymerase sigma-70 factor (ECF subfamily)